MSLKKLDRALHGPSLFEVTLGAILSVSLGVVLSAAFLIFMKPVETVKELPKESERIASTVYYVQGASDKIKGKQWMRKRQLLIDAAPGEIAISEEELNAWMAAGAPTPPPAAKSPTPARPATPGKPGAPTPAPVAPPPPEPTELVTYSVPNFRIRDNELQVGVESTVNLLSYSFPVVMQAQGGFAKRDDLMMFEPTKVYIGSLPVHRIPGAVTFLVNHALSSGTIPEDVKAVLRKVSSIDVDKRSLKVVFQ